MLQWLWDFLSMFLVCSTWRKINWKTNRKNKQKMSKTKTNKIRNANEARGYFAYSTILRLNAGNKNTASVSRRHLWPKVWFSTQTSWSWKAEERRFPASDLRFPQHVIDISSPSGGSGLPFSTAHRRGIILADFDLGKQNLNIIQ